MITDILGSSLVVSYGLNRIGKNQSQLQSILLFWLHGLLKKYKLLQICVQMFFAKM